VAGRVVTATGAVPGIPLAGILFPEPPDHRPDFGHKKTAVFPGCGFARLLELLHSKYKHTYLLNKVNLWQYLGINKAGHNISFELRD